MINTIITAAKSWWSRNKSFKTFLLLLAAACMIKFIFGGVFAVLLLLSLLGAAGYALYKVTHRDTSL